MKSCNWTQAQYSERSELVMEELKKAVDSDPILSLYAESISYNPFMVGTTPETAEPSIVICSEKIHTKSLRALFKKKATDKLYCRTGSRIWRLFKQDRKPGRPPFRLVYRQTDADDIVRMASSADLLTRCNYPDTFCGALVKHQGQQATVAASLLIDGRHVFLTVDHIFSKATESRGLESPSFGSNTSLSTLSLQPGSALSDTDTLNDDDFLSFNQLWADDDDDEYDEGDIEVRAKSSMSLDKATSFCEANSQDYCGTESPTSAGLYDGEKIYPLSATRDSRPYLDFSLIKVDAAPLGLANNIYPSGPTGTPVPLNSIAKSPRYHGAKVYVVSGASGLRTGRILKSFSCLGSKPGQEMCKVWTVIFDSGVVVPGDCGSIVVDLETFEVYGYLVASNGLGHAMVVPLAHAIDEITCCLGSSNISGFPSATLPSALVSNPSASHPLPSPSDGSRTNTVLDRLRSWVHRSSEAAFIPTATATISVSTQLSGMPKLVESLHFPKSLLRSSRSITNSRHPDDMTTPTLATKEVRLQSPTYDTIDARHNEIALAHRETCEWLFDSTKFKEWMNPTYHDNHDGVLWIQGKPGAGKSTLMKYLCDKNDFFRDHLIVKFFFQAGGEAREKPLLRMLRAITHQLVESDDTLYRSLVTSFGEKQRINEANYWQWRQPELQEFIRSSAKQPRAESVLLLIDALDEFDGPELRDAIRFLEDLSIDAYRNHIPLKICLSSRHYPNLQMNNALKLTMENDPGHQNDIAKYIRERLRVRDDEIKAEILKKAEGVFLWTVIVVSQLNKAFDEGWAKTMRETLDEFPNDLQSLFSADTGANLSDVTQRALMLQWALLSRRPLKPRELFAAVVGIAPPTTDHIQQWITNSSKGLLELRRGDAGSVQFIHSSISDFLCRQKRLQTIDPSLGPDPIIASHGQLWARSWLCISQVDTKLTSFHHLRRLIDLDPFLGYAASYILDHAERALPWHVISGDRDDKSGILENSSQSLDTSRQISIQKWLREPECWFQWWKSFIITNGSSEESLELKRHVDVGLLYVLARRGLPNLVRVILKGADINAQGGHFGNALQAACASAYNKEIVCLLLDSGADLNATGGHYNTALQAASFRGHKEIVRLLIERGADVDIKGGYYNTALQAASFGGHKEIVRLLIERGADVDIKGGYYSTALQAASFGGHEGIVRLLIEMGANVNTKGGHYGTALQAAISKGKNVIAGLLREKGATLLEIEIEETSIGPDPHWEDFLGTGDQSSRMLQGRARRMPSE
ncbi:hypothetical protein F5883DRAFT_560181 [Diaporthe sp. PMI_573]|nr:hypothetical protein F5883DRAFT_560181 [Diaporthaceae sp. PMI_573]